MSYTKEAFLLYEREKHTGADDCPCAFCERDRYEAQEEAPYEA